MLNLFFKLISILSLPTLHHLGTFIGYCIYFCKPSAAKNAKDNLKISGLAKSPESFKVILQKNRTETGKAIIETIGIWQKNEQELLSAVKNVENWQLIEEALALKKGIIFLTPHMGCFEINSIFYGSKHPITVLFRPPKLKFLLPLITKGRQRTGVTLAEANTNGVRKLMQALKRGEAIGILPDQIPKAGEGEWANFFGKPAYTMTLASKLATKTGATVIIAFGERLENGEGFAIHLTKVDSIATPTLLNSAIEKQIAQKPEQYLWQYNRYKARRHALKKQTHA
jgi:KDO2-lipid IV(A) lauroyltransferase